MTREAVVILAFVAGADTDAHELTPVVSMSMSAMFGPIGSQPGMYSPVSARLTAFRKSIRRRPYWKTTVSLAASAALMTGANVHVPDEPAKPPRVTLLSSA